MTSNRRILITCEHASAAIPAQYASLFEKDAWEEHEVFDIGARKLAVIFGKQFATQPLLGDVSRLVVDLNRSLGHPKLHLLLNETEKDHRSAVVKQYYLPFRAAFLKLVKTHSPVLHISVHSFTRHFGRDVRNADIGVLYDPRSNGERWFAGLLKREFTLGGFRTRLNYPYRGTADGHTTALRKTFGHDAYWGIELEVCNDQLRGPNDAVEHRIAAGLKQAIRHFDR